MIDAANAISKQTTSLSAVWSNSKPMTAAKLLQIHPFNIQRKLITLPETGVIIGRGHGCQLHLDEDSVSRHHARIERRNNGYAIIDSGSTNGTYVNGVKVTEQMLTPGDRIGVGKHIFKLLSCDEIESQYYEAVYEMMTCDSLTGVTNKRAFVDILKRETRRSLNTNRPLSLILFDVDHFKAVNDEHGHLAGDHVLQELACRIYSSIESHVAMARFGGEEFALLIPEMHTQQAAVVAERCRDVVAQSPCNSNVGPIPITISLGVAELNDISPDSLQPDQDFIQIADQRLYAAKAAGRNRVCFAD